MNKFNTAALVALAIAVVVLFVLHFSDSGGKTAGVAAIGNSGDSSAIMPAARIAYFEMDSLEQQYLLIKEVQANLKLKEQAISTELNGLKNGYVGRVQQLQAKAPSMNQQEGEAAQAEINQMEKNLQQKEARFAQDLQEMQFKLMQDINKRIENYLAEYNKDKQFAYIISRQAGDFIYFRDTTMNITADLIKGLNEVYNKEKSGSK